MYHVYAMRIMLFVRPTEGDIGRYRVIQINRSVASFFNPETPTACPVHGDGRTNSIILIFDECRRGTIIGSI